MSKKKSKYTNTPNPLDQTINIEENRSVDNIDTPSSNSDEFSDISDNDIKKRKDSQEE